MEFPHQPVMVPEVIRSLVTDPEGIYVDGTVGSGGHSEAIAGKITGKGRLICLDRDPAGISLSRKRLAAFGDGVSLFKSNYSDLSEVLDQVGVQAVHGILLDLGMSTYQLDYSGRGFSFGKDEPLDMRMDPEEAVDAAELVHTLSPKELERILRDYGEERRARAIVRAIVRERKKKAFGLPDNWRIWSHRSYPGPMDRGHVTRRPERFRPSELPSTGNWKTWKNSWRRSRPRSRRGADWSY